MTRIQKIAAAGISLVFFTGIFLYFQFKFTDRWTGALVVAAGLTLFQLLLWLPARKHDLINFSLAFLPAGIFAAVFATGGLRNCAGTWIGAGITLVLLILFRLRWPESRATTQTWAGLLAAMLIFSAVAGILSSL
ncbi:MAG: hypothetical protein K5910_02990 [Bacteroidales bacterium]|nr:hypothetical protein [Bacteroidales bacterium]